MKTEGDLISGVWAKTYETRFPLKLIGWIYKEIIRHLNLKQGDKLLDVGCGTGTIIWSLRDKYEDRVNLTGIDPSQDMIDIAEHKGKINKNISFVVGGGQNLPFKDNSFDWVISSLAFHHMPEKIKLKTLREMRRVLRPDGKLLLTDWAKPVNLLGRFISLFIKDHSYAGSQINGALENLFKKVGFKSARILSVQAGIIYHYELN